MQYLSIREWDTYQHYKDRSPPWIKLHRTLLTSPTWVSMDDANRVLAIALMLLAAATGNRIMADPTYIQRVSYLNKRPDWSKLISIGFIEIVDETGAASTNLADASTTHTNGTIETETDKRQSREEKKDGRRGPKPRIGIDPDWKPSEADREFAQSLQLNPDEVAPEFVDWNISNSTISADWSRNFRNRCRQLARWRDERTSRSGRMVHRQKPNSLVAAVRQAVADAEGQP